MNDNYKDIVVMLDVDKSGWPIISTCKLLNKTCIDGEKDVDTNSIHCLEVHIVYSSEFKKKNKTFRGLRCYSAQWADLGYS